MAGSALVYILLTGDLPPFVVVHRMISGIDSFPLLAVPFFILAGNLMNNAGITNRIYNFALALVGWLKGGLGHVNIIGSVIFAGMSRHGDRRRRGPRHDRDQGDAATTATTSEFSVGVTAASATLGPIIPPSLPFVIYGMMANVSVGAAVPRRHPARRRDGDPDDADGRLLRAQEQVGRATSSSSGTRVGKALVELGGRRSAGRCCCGRVIAARRCRPISRRSSAWRCCSSPTGSSSFEAVLPIMTPVLLIGGMTTGVFTPTEGAIAACVWALILGLRLVPHADAGRCSSRSALDTIETTATVLFIVAAASIFGWMLTATRVTDDDRRLGAGASPSKPWVFLLLANLLMLFVGCFLEPTAAITILVPILLPIAAQLGIDPVHFGLVMVLNLMIGLLHPPMGMVLFVLARVAGLSFERTTMAILPWLVPLLVSLVIITYVPAIVLWLPRMFM